jgi:hypothetical protein
MFVIGKITLAKLLTIIRKINLDFKRDGIVLKILVATLRVLYQTRFFVSCLKHYTNALLFAQETQSNFYSANNWANLDGSLHITHQAIVII